MDNSEKTQCGNLQKPEENSANASIVEVPKDDGVSGQQIDDEEPVIEELFLPNTQKPIADEQMISDSQKLVEDEIQMAPSTSVSFQNMDEIKKDMEEKSVRICRNLDEVRQLYEKSQIMSGQVSLQEKKEQHEREQAEKGGQVDPKILKIPPTVFEGINYVMDGGLDDDWFDYTAFHIVINWLEMCIYGKVSQPNEVLKPDPNWDKVIEFPDIISNEGRLRLHDISTYFQLGDHSAGKKGKNRHLIMYPKNLYIEKQNTEKGRIERERAKLWEKFT